MADSRLEIFRVPGFNLNISDFQDFQFPGSAPIKRKFRTDRKCSVEVANYAEGNENYLGITENADSTPPRAVSIMTFRTDGSDLLVLGLGNGQSPSDLKDMKFSVRKEADGGQTLEASWNQGFFGETASLTLTLNAAGNVRYARAETGERDTHMLGRIATFFVGRTVHQAECRFD